MAVIATDKYPQAGGLAQDPAVKAFAVTKSDTDELAVVSRAIYVGGAGNIAVILRGDTVAVTLTSVPAGALLPICARQVMSTNTTATNIVALY